MKFKNINPFKILLSELKFNKYIFINCRTHVNPSAVNRTDLNTLSFEVLSTYLSILKVFELETPQ